jgi:hypothetical protein
VNVQAFQELKRVLQTVPEAEFSLLDWNRCACGHATRDSWFREQGFTTCCDFVKAAAFFEIPRYQAEELFSAPYRAAVTPAMVVRDIDRLLPGTLRKTVVVETERHARRQDVINELLARANRAAQKAKRVTIALVSVFF